MISTALSRRDNTGTIRRRLVIAVTVQEEGGRARVERALIDSGAEENCYLWLAAIDPLLGFRARAWWHNKATPSVDVTPAKEFYKETEGKGLYCVVVRELPRSRRIRVVSTTVQEALPTGGVPPKYQDYADVFDASAASILPEHHPIEHRIELEPSTKLL
ncbi:hypothetical protein V493_00164 [Pseudogymnoascus sp. VKM F-4281 (FW-2241)]|nr:hypothetical protein V493_00164 [Pseudogymnoascus sp. VKM F-4281 (FW-2241)]